jgi:UDP-N-acetylmuramate--alanine ligase
MKGVGTDIGTIHFVGIGGIGMSGIAEVMHNLGYSVQGSDIAEGASVERLRARGIEVMIGHARPTSATPRWWSPRPRSSATTRSRRRARGAHSGGPRAEMLAELMRLKRTVAVAGTHGKTTTTSMVAALLDAGGIDPTVINGGIIESYGSNARLGDSEWMVVEADESDGSFLRLDGTIAVVTNIDPEHLDHYGSFDAVKEAFVEFIENVPFYGAAVLCIDHPEVQKVIARVRDRRVITYGFSAQADWRADSIRSHEGGNLFDAIHTDRDGNRRTISNIALPMPGPAQRAERARGDRGRGRARLRRRHDPHRLRPLRRGAPPLHPRRRSRRGNRDRRLRAPPGRDPRGARGCARGGAGPGDRGRPAAPLHPLRDLLGEFQSCFNDADMVFVAPVYPAGEAPIPGIDSAALVGGLRERGHRAASEIASAAELAERLKDLVAPGDFVVCLGAGDITKWARGSRRDRVAAGARGMTGQSALTRTRAARRLGRGHRLRRHRADQRARQAHRRRAARQARVVQERRRGRLAVRAGRPRRPDALPRRARRGHAADGARPRLEPDRAATAACPAWSCGSASVRRGRGRATRCSSAAGARAHPRRLDRARRRHRRARVPARHPRHRRRLRAHERRRLRPRGGRHPRRLRPRDARRQRDHRAGGRSRLHLPPLRAARRRDRRRRAVQGHARRPKAIGAEMDRIAYAREESQPLRSKTGGSTFKNPPGDKAWRLVDAAGCRGLQMGGAQVSEKHANFLINTGDATSADIEGSARKSAAACPKARA